MADASPRTDTSTDVDTDEKNQLVIFCSISALTILQNFPCILDISYSLGALYFHLSSCSNCCC